VRDMDAGRDVQLGVYLAALERLFLVEGQSLAGGGYYSLKTTGSRRNNGLYRSDLQSHTQIKSGTASSLSVDRWRSARTRIEEYVFRFFDSIRDGDFRIAPSQDEKTCSYCDCAIVCRFEKHRSRRKRLAERRSSLDEGPAS